MKCFLSLGFGAAVVHLERKDAEVPVANRQEQKMMCQQGSESEDERKDSEKVKKNRLFRFFKNDLTLVKIIEK